MRLNNKKGAKVGPQIVTERFGQILSILFEPSF
jgi:hypothetical protein